MDGVTVYIWGCTCVHFKFLTIWSVLWYIQMTSGHFIWTDRSSQSFTSESRIVVKALVFFNCLLEPGQPSGLSETGHISKLLVSLTRSRTWLAIDRGGSLLSHPILFLWNTASLHSVLVDLSETRYLWTCEVYPTKFFGYLTFIQITNTLASSDVISSTGKNFKDENLRELETRRVLITLPVQKLLET